MSFRYMVRKVRSDAIPEANVCTNCGIKWRQDGDLCRRCARAMGDQRNNLAREAEQVARMERRLAEAARPQDEHRLPRPPKTIVAHGREYDVVWDGA